MLQLTEYPNKIQPRSSSTRQPCQEEDEEMTQDKVDAEASRILMDLANQDKTVPLKNLIETMSLNNEVIKKQQQEQDPIMLLAAAAAAIDDGGKYKKRSYERREIKLQPRYGTSKRKSISYNEEMHDIRRHRGIKSSVSSLNTCNHTSEANGNDSQNAFSWQYLSMKKNPRIKRNAMHAYITYMIFTDMAHSNNSNHHHPYNHHTKAIYNQKEQDQQDERIVEGRKTYDGLSEGGGGSSINKGGNRYRQSTNNEAIIGRPLTDFLFERNNNNNSLLPPIQGASSNATNIISSTYERSPFV